MDHQQMRVIVTGSRTWTDAETITRALDWCHAWYGAALVIVHGACPRGADALTAAWCEARGVTQEPHPARWRDQHGHVIRSAGMDRNREMINAGALGVLAFIADNSPGASHCATHAERHGIRVRKWTA